MFFGAYSIGHLGIYVTTHDNYCVRGWCVLIGEYLIARCATESEWRFGFCRSLPVLRGLGRVPFLAVWNLCSVSLREDISHPFAATGWRRSCDHSRGPPLLFPIEHTSYIPHTLLLIVLEFFRCQSNISDNSCLDPIQ